MAVYIKKPIEVEATQWFKIGDHASVSVLSHNSLRPYCDRCGGLLVEHGVIGTIEGGHIVCPNDWIITGFENEKYACKPDIFNKTYKLKE